VSAIAAEQRRLIEREAVYRLVADRRAGCSSPAHQKELGMARLLMDARMREIVVGIGIGTLIAWSVAVAGFLWDAGTLW
jgi:hypothetical protein